VVKPIGSSAAESESERFLPRAGLIPCSENAYPSSSSSEKPR
jgi:hypothetical protein